MFLGLKFQNSRAVSKLHVNNFTTKRPLKIFPLKERFAIFAELGNIINIVIDELIHFSLPLADLTLLYGMKDRRMVYPYTWGAKIALFPYKFYFKHCLPYRYLILSMVFCTPIFYKLQKLSCGEGGYKKLRQFRERELEEIIEHQFHAR